MSENEDRALQIRLAQLNADLQFYIASLFGLFAITIAAWVFGSQLILENFPKIDINTIFAIPVYIIAILASIGTLMSGSKLIECRNEFKKLK